MVPGILGASDFVEDMLLSQKVEAVAIDCIRHGEEKELVCSSSIFVLCVCVLLCLWGCAYFVIVFIMG